MKRKEKIVFALSCVLLVVLLFVVAALTDDRVISSATATAIVSISTVLFLAYGVYLLVKMLRWSKKQKTSRLKRHGATMSGTLKHISGLPIAKGLMVEMFYGPEKIVFVKDGQEVSVDRSKVTGIDSVFGRNATRKAMSGAATGKYVIGGKTGAAVGALASMDTQLVISYTSDGKAKNIVLDSSSSGMFPSRVVKDFKQTSTVKRSKVEL